MEDFIRHAETNLSIAQIQRGSRKYSDVMELIHIFSKQDHNLTPLHETVDLFNSLARFENLPSPQAVFIGKNNVDTLKPWQKYIIKCFKQEEFTPIPLYARSMSAMWKLATYDHFLTDTVHYGGTVMPVVLSMAIKPKVITEFGVHGGFTTLKFCRLNPEARVHAVDIHSRMPDANLINLPFTLIL